MNNSGDTPQRTATRAEMSMEDWNYCERAMRVASMAEVESLLADFADSRGFRHYGLARMRHSGGRSSGTEQAQASAAASVDMRRKTPEAQPRNVPGDGRSKSAFERCHNLPGELGLLFDSLHRPEVAATEPRILQARLWLPPASWNSLGRSNYTPPARIQSIVRRKLMMTGEFGVHSGLTVPLHGPGIDWAFLTLSSDVRVPPSELVPLLSTTTYFSHCLQAGIARLSGSEGVPTNLSGREAEILRWSALGKTSWEISTILMISERTVNFHLQRAAAKLGVKGRRAAVAQALARGLIRL